MNQLVGFSSLSEISLTVHEIPDGTLGFVCRKCRLLSLDGEKDATLEGIQAIEKHVELHEAARHKVHDARKRLARLAEDEEARRIPVKKGVIHGR